MTRKMLWSLSLPMVAAFVMAVAPAIPANGLQFSFHLGRMWTNPEDDGDAAAVMQFPAGIPRKGAYGDATTGNFARGWIGQQNKGGTYLNCINWTDPDNTVWEYAGSYFFRSMNYGYPPSYLNDGKFDYLYPVDRQEYLRWDRPQLIVVVNSSTGVDSLISFQFHPDSVGLSEFAYPASSGRGPRPREIIDPDLVTEKVLMTKWRYIPGVELTRHTYGWGFGTPHQDYIVHDMTLVNNGISGRLLSELPHPPDDPPILEDQNLEKVVWARSHDFDTKAAAGTMSGKDNACMYVQPWGDPGHHAALAWDTDDPESPGPDWGDPTDDEAYENHLLGNGYCLYGALFVSQDAGANRDVDDLEQPAFRTVWYERGFDMKGEAPYTNVGDVQAQREFMLDGSIHLPDNTNYADFAGTAAVAADSKGPTAVIVYGPKNGDRNLDNVKLHGWDMAWLDTVRIVNVLAISGLERETARTIGAKWTAAKAASLPEAQWMSAADIDLVKSGRDSVMKAAALAYWNFNGEWPPNVTGAELTAWGLTDHVAAKPTQYGPYDAVDGPRPPGFLSLRPAPKQGIEVRWGDEPETAVDQDTKVNDFAGYRVYRQDASRLAPWVVVEEGPAANFGTAAQDGDIPAGRVYMDTDVTPGVDYWYCVVAYDDGTQNWEHAGKSLESTRWWTWSGYLHLGVTAPTQVSVESRALPGRFALEQNVPNPFNPQTTIRFSLNQSAPTQLVIYNLMGQAVRTLVNAQMAPGVHTIVWDGNDSAGRPLASGVYLYRLTNGENVAIRRMTLLK